MLNKKILLFLTSCVNPGHMPNTVVLDHNIRLKQYLKAINWYIQRTSFDIAIIDNSGFNYLPYLNKNKRIVLIKSFNGNTTFNLKLGKGYGEGLIINELIKEKELLSTYDYIVKVSGRHIILNISILIKTPLYILSSSNIIIAKYQASNKFATSDIFLSNPHFYETILYKHLQNINEAKKIYFEHALYNAIIEAQKKNYRYIPFAQPIKQIGISGSMGTTLSTNYSLRYKLSLLKNFIKSILIH